MQPFIAGVSDLTASKAREGMVYGQQLSFSRELLCENPSALLLVLFCLFFFKEKAKHGLFLCETH